MPTPPQSGESKQKFVSRCIKYLMDNNEADDIKQAAGHCYGLWDQKKKKSKATISFDKDEIIIE